MALRVLLLTPQFYDIEKTISSVLEESGYEVIWLENKTLSFDYHGSYSKFKILRRIYFLIFSPQKRYLKKAFEKIGNLRFDILFSINGHSVCPFLFKKLKNINHDLSSILYLWDSFSMYDWSGEILLFSKVYSFDREDCLKNNLEYKPLFHIKNSQRKDEGIESDLFFVGKFSPERLSMLDKLLKAIQGSGLKYFVRIWPAYRIFLHNSIVYHFLKILNFNSFQVKKFILNYEAVEGILERDYIIPQSINYKEVQDRLLNSKVVLDLPYSHQSGYTHRLIEALANGKKILTTNSKILNESFYNPKQIHLIDSLNPEINVNWLKEKSQFNVDRYISDLELHLWLKSVLDVRMA